MEHYPDIQRHQGTLFFIPHGNRAAIALSIERLIDLLDATDGNPDDEDGGDLEPNHGSAERHPNGWGGANDSQERWADGVRDDREDDGDDLEPSLLCQDYRWGRVEVDLESDGSDDEYSHGWTDHIDQDKAIMNCCGVWVGEGEPELGFVGISTGWREGEDKQDREADQLGADQLEVDISDYEPWLGWTEVQSSTGGQFIGDEFPRFEDGLALFDGSGIRSAEFLLSRAKPRLEPYGEIIGTRHHMLQDGSIFTTLVPR